MAPIEFNPADAGDEREGGGFQHQPGRYVFKIDSAKETLFKPNAKGVRNTGIKLMLLVDEDGARYEAKCFDNLVNTPRALWRLRALCKAVGVPFASPFDESVLEGKLGVAEFRVEDGYLRVDYYLDREEAAEMIAAKSEKSAAPEDHDYGPPPMEDGDVPF